MEQLYYVGLDIHKKIIAYCIKLADGTIIMEGKLEATRLALKQWAQTIPGPWIGAMEATIFTGWIYDFLKPMARQLQVGNPLMMKAISSAKKKNDKLDARTIADLVRCNLLPCCYMASQEIRDLRRVLRYRKLMVRQTVRMKNRTAALLMETGVEYNKKKLHGAGYFKGLLETLQDEQEPLREVLRMSRGGIELFDGFQKKLLKGLANNQALRQRVQRLMSIECVGQITALTWALEIGDPHRFSSIAKAISYCGLCSSQVESAGKTLRMPLSKQRNKHLQSVLIEAAKLAPRYNKQLADVYEKECRRGCNHNQATIAIARKLVAFLLAVDKSGKAFVKKPEKRTKKNADKKAA
jgi:transposase